MLSSTGQSIIQIAAQTSRNAHTIRLWLKRYLSSGIEGLKTRKQPGRRAKLAPAIDLKLAKIMNKSPQAYGYQESGWQINLLKDYFNGQGISACDNTIRYGLNVSVKLITPVKGS